MVTNTAELFDLQVLATARASGLWVSATSRLGSALALPVSADTSGRFRSPREMTDRFRRTVAEGGRNANSARDDGIALRDATFGVEEIGALLRRTRGAAAAAGRPVLVRLFAAPAETAALPWELMADPDQPDQPLALAADVHFARAAQIRTYALRGEPISPPINVLLVLSNPAVADGESGDENPLFDHYEERRQLVAELRPLVERGLLAVTVEDRPSLDQLQRRLGAEPRGFHVVHYLGHARPQHLKLESPEGRPLWVESGRVSELLRRGCPDLRLVVFAGCQTAVSADVDGESVRRAGTSITDCVVQAACPTVIGMQAVLPFRTEQIFARVFYQALCAGRSIAQAVNQARVAIRGDDVVGGALLDWAVPILVTGDAAGPLVDPDATAVSRSPSKDRFQLKLGLDEPDREFFARFLELRTVMDVLCSCRPERVVVISGGPGVGKTRLLARALDELDDDVGCVLYLHAERLARPGPDGTVDPVATLCSLVAELLGRAEPVQERAPNWSSADWWERLVEELVDRTFVLAIEDIDRVSPSISAPVGDAVGSLVRRRSRSRVVLTAQQHPHELLGGAATYAVPVRLEPVAENDVDQWVRRNRPVLAALLRQRPTLLQTLFRTKLSSRLELWSALAAEVTAQLDGELIDDADVLAAADRLLAKHPAQVAAQPSTPEADAEAPAEALVRTRSGPLKVVVAGPHASGRGAQFAEVIAARAKEHVIAGRVVAGDEPDQATSIAALLDIESPFDSSGGAAGTADIVGWLEIVAERSPDVVLLDYGGPAEDPAHTEVLRRMADAGALLIAAGGNGDEPTYPAHLDVVLAVGALGDDETTRPYSPWFARKGKPDLYACDNLAGGPLALAVREQGVTQGTSFAALRVLVAAVLVWSVDRTRTAEEIWALLVESGGRIRGRRRTGRQPRQLDEAAAIAAARATLVLSALRFGALDASGLSVASGLDVDVAQRVASDLAHRKLVQANEDRFELTS